MVGREGKDKGFEWYEYAPEKLTTTWNWFEEGRRMAVDERAELRRLAFGWSAAAASIPAR